MTDATRTENTTKRDAEIYREAARRIETGVTPPYACIAVCEVAALIEQHDLCSRMKALLAPEGVDRAFWLGDVGDTQQERTDGRIVALCFMAAMVEAGDA